VTRLPRAAASASASFVLDAARAMLARGHAVDAVVAGVFAAAAHSPSVLLGPVQVLVGGAGTGLHAVDGRVQQPGKGLPRPRGFAPGEDVPRAARAGVPALVAALGTTLASFGSLPLARVLAPAVDLARRASKPRATLLQRIAERGARAMTEARVAGELVLAAGRGQGGLLSERDLEELRPKVVRAESTEATGQRLVTVPWGAAAVRDPASPACDASRTRVVAAADARGQLAVACYELAEHGLVIEALDLVAPLVASPVLRGKTRVPAGVACTTAAPIALCEAEGVLDLVAGVFAETNAETTLGKWLRALRSEDGALAEPESPEELIALARVGKGIKTL
jgi:Gamma-glutamyltranspeptidase